MTTERGENAAMLAALAGRLDQAEKNEETQYKRELPHTVVLFHFKQTVLAVFGVHLAVAVVSFIFILYHPSSAAAAGDCSPFVQLRDFGAKAFILAGVNLWLQFPGTPSILSHPKTMLTSLSWNIDLFAAWTPFCAMSFAFLSFLFVDLKAAHKSSRLMIESGKAAERTVTAHNIYQDPKVPLTTCLHTFLMSSLFVAFYVSALLSPVQLTLFSRAMWAGGLFVQVYVTAKDLGGPESKGPWTALGRWMVCLQEQANHDIWAVMIAQSDLAYTALDDKPLTAPKLSCAEVYLRFCMCYIADGFYRSLIVYSLPIYLATSCRGANDFALNAFAVAFISELDDLPEKVECSCGTEDVETSRNALLSAE